jgi:uncharacterized membrane protein YcaP (DUF421 family)
MITILLATLMYWVLLAVLRIIGRRAISQLSPFELLVIFLLGGIATQVIVADDHSAASAMTGMFTIAVNHAFVSVLKGRSQMFQKIVDGTPVVLVANGKIDRDILRGLRMHEEDVMAVARQNGIKGRARRGPMGARTGLRVAGAGAGWRGMMRAMNAARVRMRTDTIGVRCGTGEVP